MPFGAAKLIFFAKEFGDVSSQKLKNVPGEEILLVFNKAD